ncbi:MAG: hypothetical protein CL424_20420 [Acidimicrobiaceae bacterium]|nr:hypothetical protein [Acidimicrobiaceae bacterium]
MNDSSIPASHRDPIENPRVAVRSTVGADGYPQSTAVLILLDGQQSPGSSAVITARSLRHTRLMRTREGSG